jgi:flagellar assembly protein FliH
MATVIKSGGSLPAQETGAFNFDDMAAKAQAYLEQVRAQAAQILAQAGTDAAAIRARAEKEGHAAALKKIDQTVAERVTRHVATLTPAIRQSVAEIQQAKQAWLNHWETQALRVATAIAARVIRRELERAPQITMTLVREALELAAGAGEMQLQLHPGDHQALGQDVRQVIETVGKMARVEVVASNSVSRGGCRVETRFGVIDQTVEAQLARIEEELL